MKQKLSERIGDVYFTKWLLPSGSIVEKNDTIAEVDTDKVTTEILAEVSGELIHIAKEGDTVKEGEIFCEIKENIDSVVKQITDKF